LETVKRITELSLDELARSFETSITGGKTLEHFMEALGYSEELEEQYLTDVNKMYETNNLEREA
jgi:hypothetical protein